MILSSELVFIKIKNTILRPLRSTYLLKITMLLQLLLALVLSGFYLKKNAADAARLFSVNKFK